jgi:hypothetical protein
MVEVPAKRKLFCFLIQGSWAMATIRGFGLLCADLGDLSAFVVAAQQSNVCRISRLEEHQKRKCFHAIVPAVYKIALLANQDQTESIESGGFSNNAQRRWMMRLRCRGYRLALERMLT